MSGLHISILGAGFLKLLERLNIRLRSRALMCILLLFMYGLMTGFSVSGARAVFMFALSMLAICLKRSYDTLTALMLAAVLILSENPLYIFYSGFVFSFGCILGIAVLLPPLTCDKEKKLSYLQKTVLSSASLTVVTFPVYLWFDYGFPVYSALLNIIIIPLMSILVPLGFLLLLCSYILPFAIAPLKLMICGMLKLIGLFAEASDSLPCNFLILGKPYVTELIICLLLLSSVIILKKKLRLFAKWFICFLALIILLIRTDTGLESTFLDVGQGDGIFIRESRAFSDDFTMLIDGGSTSEDDVGKYRILPFLKYKGVRNIDAVLITHSDKDHYSGIIELMESGKNEGIRIKRLLLPDIAGEARSDEFLKIIGIADENDISVSFIHSDQMLIPDKRLKLLCVAPAENMYVSDMNDGSAALYLTYGNFSALYTGDIQGKGEEYMTGYLKENVFTDSEKKQLSVLKTAHHGSKNSTPEDFLLLTKPRISVISCGLNNSYHHPHDELIKRLEDIDTGILRTDTMGAVTIKTNGKRIKLSTFVSQ